MKQNKITDNLFDLTKSISNGYQTGGMTSRGGRGASGAVPGRGGRHFSGATAGSRRLGVRGRLPGGNGVLGAYWYPEYIHEDNDQD